VDSATLRQVEDLRRAQSAELAALDREQGKAPSLVDLRAINDLANEHRLLFANLELRLPEQRPDDTPARYRTVTFSGQFDVEKGRARRRSD